MNPLLAGILSEEELAELERNKTEKQVRLSKSLTKVMEMALEDTGGSRVCRDFLLSLYNGHAYPFNLNDMRNLDQGLFDACINIMAVDCRPFPPNEIHEYWKNGDEIFTRLKLSRNREQGL